MINEYTEYRIAKERVKKYDPMTPLYGTAIRTMIHKPSKEMREEIPPDILENLGYK